MIGNMKDQWIGNYKTTWHKGFESFNNRSKILWIRKKEKQLSYQQRHVDSSNQSLSYKVVIMEKTR